MRLTRFLLPLLLAGCMTRPGPPAAPLARAGVAFTTTGESGAFAEGVADPAANRALTPDDPARIASVSKLVVAIGVMKLVEAGKLDLGADVSDTLGWRLRNPAFPDRPISLRMLLSHTASVRDHDDQYVVPLGATVEAAMADPRSWDPAHGPGANYFAYSNMNFGIVGTLIERATGERFDRWMRREVLEPMGIDACFNWPTCSDAAVKRAVVLTRAGKPVRDDLNGRQPDCPVFIRDGDACDLTRLRPGDNGALFSPQGGLRISMRGLARVGRMLLGRGTLDGVRILAPSSVDALLAQGWRFDGRNGATDRFICSYGLATQRLATGDKACADDPDIPRGLTLVGHAGEAYGLRSGLWIDPARGVGFAYFVTDQPDSTPGDATMTAAEADTFRRTLALLPR